MRWKLKHLFGFVFIKVIHVLFVFFVFRFKKKYFLRDGLQNSCSVSAAVPWTCAPSPVLAPRVHS